MKDVLQHPLGPLSWALANDDESLKKTNKSVLARKLEGNSSPAEIILQPTVWVIDGMSILHKMSEDNMTFEELLDQLFASVLRASAGCTRIDLKFDVVTSYFRRRKSSWRKGKFLLAYFISTQTTI